jgi:hypothetical protein
LDPQPKALSDAATHVLLKARLPANWTALGFDSSSHFVDSASLVDGVS